MSLGTLGQYGSDSSSNISDSDDDNSKELSEPGDSLLGPREVREEPSTPPPLVCTDPLSLASEGNCEESDSDSSSISPQPHKTHPETTPLPLPDIDKMLAGNHSYSNSELVTKSNLSESTQCGGLVDESSVFFNPYKKAEEKKLAMLKKHVTEFDKKPETRTETSRNEYGWSHVKKNRVERPGDVKHGSFPTSQLRESSDLFDDSDSSISALKKRKHRSGVKDSLVPPKKYLKMHEKIQGKERPWTMKR